MQSDLREVVAHERVDPCELGRRERLHGLQRLERQALLVVNAFSIELVGLRRALDRAVRERQLLAAALRARERFADLRDDRVVELVAS